MRLYLIRHGETAWSLSAQHTGRTDIPLTPQGEEDVRALAERLGLHLQACEAEGPTEAIRAHDAPITR
jgi:broad specificity phosphatase PhoE